MSIDQLASVSAGAIRDAFDSFHREFKEITRRARIHFERRHLAGFRQDAAERLDLYKKITTGIVAGLRTVLGEHICEKEVWARMKRRYTELITGHYDLEIAETFFNSITRKIFATAGVDPNIEYVDSDFESFPRPVGSEPIYRVYAGGNTTTDLIKRILGDYQFSVDYQDIELDARLIASRIESESHAPIDAIEVVRSVFYRNKKACIIGRIRRGDQLFPLAIVLLNREAGVIADAVMLTQNEVSIMFSFTRWYFHVEAERPHEMIAFLKSIMPLKPVAELYISIGYNKHGKTELYRDLLHHLQRSDDRFETARGKKGMVMAVFTLSNYDIVFKIIKDKPAYPKTSTRKDVVEKYHLVFMHDRAGRLVDAQEFEHLKFEKNRFNPELLAELLETCAESVFVDGESVVIKHLYTERKLSPLNLYVKEMPFQAAVDAIIDYGNAIKDLVAANIFPGDILLKNFGVTRHGRVVFYDYDELCLLTECNFRAIPKARNYNDELDPEPWFYVGESDIFPEEFISFLELEGDLRRIFLEQHGDIFGVDFWLGMQRRLKAGELPDIFPYRDERRLRRAETDSPALQSI